MKALLRRIRQILRDRRTRRIFTRFVSTVAAIVVFVTTYALVLPAITMESRAECGIEAHQHDESCYTDVLVCEIPESPGHVHDESCYSTGQKLVCRTEEHMHEPDCYDENGQLICGKAEHQHGEDCFEEEQELVCGLTESDGHQHDDSCYQKVLTCGKEAHTHSAACYHVDSAGQSATEAIAVASTESAAAGENSPDGGLDVGPDAAAEYSESETSPGASTSSAGNSAIETGPDSSTSSAENSAFENSSFALTDEAGADYSGARVSAGASTGSAADTAASAGASTGTAAGTAESAGASTGSAADTGASSAAGYVPVLDELDFDTLLNKFTGIYYSRPDDTGSADDGSADTGSADDGSADAGSADDGSADTGSVDAGSGSDADTESGGTDTSAKTGEAREAAAWNRADRHTELTESDKLRLYLAYTVPAGSLNETNQTARYRLPANVRLTDEQVNSINTTVNGITAQYVSYDTLEILDQEMYEKYLGIEAVEGTRAPSDDLSEYLADHGGQEFISATVKVENVYDEETGALKAQEMVFTFAPYTIQKNQHQYDTEGQPIKAGEEVKGWLAVEIGTEQIEWEEADGEVKAADILFVEKDKKAGLEEISTELRLIETADDPDAGSKKTADADGPDAADADKKQDGTKDSGAEDGETENGESDKAGKEPVSYPSVSFDDSITVAGGSLSTDADAVSGDERLTAETEITVRVEADKGTFPEGTTMVLSAVSDDRMSAVAQAVEGAVDSPKTMGFHAVDISFRNAEGKEIEPLKSIRVSMTSDAIKRAVEDVSTAPVVVHVSDPAADGTAPDRNTDDGDRETTAVPDENSDNGDSESAAGADGNTEDEDSDSAAAADAVEGAEDRHGPEPSESMAEQASENSQEAPAAPTATVIEASTGTDEGQGDTLTFKAEDFSVYAVVYTVDFHWEVNGKMYDFSIPGGGFVSLEHVVEVLGIATADENSENGAENAENDPENADDFVGEVPGVDVSDENSTAYEEAIKLNEVEVSEATKKFVADVVSVEFSNPELVWVGKVDSVVTVGGLKEANGLEVEYSAELTEEQITEINAQTVEAGDWALISVQPFTREETLTVTMKNGDQFVVRVTDAQISTHVITADGEDYLITVTYGPEAEIPDGSRLEAKEILADTEKYESMLEQSINVLSEGGNTEIVFSRFFDISILNEEGIEIEPAKPVDVSIQYTHPIDMEGAKPSVVHFADNGIEVIQPETRLSGDGKEGTINVFEYEQGSFSGVGTIIETDTLEDGQYFLVVGDNGSYYAMKNDGSLVPVTYYHQTKQVEAAPGVNENDLLWNVSGVGYGYYTFKAVNGDNYLSLQNGSVVNNSSANVLVRHNSWDESQNETGGYYIYHTPNPWDSNTWNPLRLGYWDNASHFYVGEDNSNPQRIKLYKYAMASSTGEPPVTNTYTGIEVNPSELDEWLMSLFDDMPVGDDGYHKTAEVYDYENRIYQIDFTAQSNAQGFASDIDIAFSVDMSNSMLFPSTMTSIGTIELKQSVLESTLEKDQVYFVISDVKGTATVNALYYDEGGRGEWYNGQYYTVPAGWRFEDASKYARGQRKAAHQTDSDANLDKYVEDYTGFKIQGTDTGFYTLYKADEGYLNYINSGQSVYENPYNRLADMKDSLRMAFNFLDVMSEKYHCKVRVGWNGFAKDVVDGNNYDYRCRENNHTLKDLSQVDYRTILTGITQAGNQTGGGTRPDKAFIDAANMGWGNNTQKYLILITDGAPQGGGASSAAAALTLGKNEGRNLTNTQGVNIVSIGLSTEHVDGAASLFEYISCQDPNPGSDQQMIYQAKDGDALKNAVVDALRIMVTKAITVGTIKDTIDPAFYPVSTDGTPLKSGDKIDLNGKLTTDTSKPYGTIGWDANNKCWTVEWKEQDFAWPDEEHPHGWHGRVLVKAKENFLGGNDISTNKGQASLDVIKAKVPVKNPDGSWRFQDTSFQSLMNVTNDQLQTRYMDTPHVNVDELEMTKNDTEWTVYLNTEVDPGEQMEALFNEIKVMKVVTDGEHEMVVPDGKTAKDVMVYDLVPTENGNYSYEEASSDARDKRNVDQAFFYLKDLFSMKDSLNNDFIIDNMTAEQAIAKLLAGEKVEVKYQGYGHGTTDKPVGKIILELKADPSAQVNNLDSHNASPVGNAVEKYILSAEYKPTPEEGSGDWYWNTGTFGTKDRGKVAEDKIKYNTHIINVIKRILTIQKVNSDGNPITDADAGEAQFEIYQKDTSGSKINSSTVTTSGLSYTWDYVVPDEDQKKPGDYWVDNTTYYIKEVKAPKGYAAFDGEITVTLGIEDTATDIPNLGDNEKVPYNWEQTATLGASGDSNYVTVTGSPDITIAVKNDKSIDITVIKTDTDNVEIPGAKFSITKGSAIQTDIKVIKKGGSWDNEEDRINVENGVFTIPAGGVTVLGLGAGDYTLTETEPPAGYIKTLRAIKFTAGRDGTVTYTNAADNPEPKVKPANDNKQYTVQNEPGAALPNTGGPGTTLIYLLGSILILGAGVLLWRRRRLI